MNFELSYVLLLLAVALPMSYCGWREYQTPRPPAPCVTHVPNADASPGHQCKRGAGLAVVQGAALCVCPPGVAVSSEARDDDE